MIDTRFALPQRSPKPFRVPWTCSAPSRTAASEFATAHSPSLCAWMPRRRPDVPPRRPHDLRHLRRQAAAVRVAQHEAAGPGALGRAQGLERVVAVALEAVEVVLGVVDDLLDVPDEEGHRVGDHEEVLGQRRLERVGDVEGPGLAEDRGDRRARLDEGLEARVGLGGDAGPPRRAEGGHPRVLERHVEDPAKEPQVLRVRARPAALDVVDAERVEPLGQADLVLHGEGHALALGAVPERRVVDLDLARHGGPSCPPWGAPEGTLTISAGQSACQETGALKAERGRRAGRAHRPGTGAPGDGPSPRRYRGRG